MATPSADEKKLPPTDCKIIKYDLMLPDIKNLQALIKEKPDLEWGSMLHKLIAKHVGSKAGAVLWKLCADRYTFIGCPRPTGTSMYNGLYNFILQFMVEGFDPSKRPGEGIVVGTVPPAEVKTVTPATLPLPAS